MVLLWALWFLPTIPLPGGGIPSMIGECVSNRRIELKKKPRWIFFNVGNFLTDKKGRIVNMTN